MLIECDLRKQWEPDLRAAHLLKQQQVRRMALHSSQILPELANASPWIEWQVQKAFHRGTHRRQGVWPWRKNASSSMASWSSSSSHSTFSSSTALAFFQQTPVPSRSVPLALVEALPPTRLSWQVQTTGRSKEDNPSKMALLVDDALLVWNEWQGDNRFQQNPIRSPTTHATSPAHAHTHTHTHTQAHAQAGSAYPYSTSFFLELPLRFDPQPTWRRLCWSGDGRFIAVSFSDGSIQVVRVSHGERLDLAATIQAEEPSRLNILRTFSSKDILGSGRDLFGGGNAQVRPHSDDRAGSPTR